MKTQENTGTDPASLEARWRHMGIHRASQAARPDTWSTGWPALDRILPGGGYPLAAVTEWLVEHPGIGELGLLFKALAPRLKACPRHRLALINPPYRLEASALDAAGIDRSRLPVIQCHRAGEALWSVEQLAAVGGFAGLVLWEDSLDMSALRRLQLASEKAGCPIFVYRPLVYARQRSPAALRLTLVHRQGRQQIEVLKCRGPGGARATGLHIGRHSPWQSSETGDARQNHTVSPTPADNETWPEWLAARTTNENTPAASKNPNKKDENNDLYFCKEKENTLKIETGGSVYPG